MGMYQFGRFLQMQIKRAIRVLPAVLTAMLLLCGSVGAAGLSVLSAGQSDETRQKVSIGLVGDTSETYFEFGIQALASLDSSRMVVDFYTLTEEEAKEWLREGKLSAYVQIPERFLESVVRGENKKAAYVAADGQKGIASLTMQEIADAVSLYVTSSQTAIFSMQMYLAAHGMTDQYWEHTKRLNLRYIEAVLGRTDMVSVEELGIGNHLSMPDYYLGAVIVFALLLQGMACSAFFARKNTALCRVLSSRGLGAGKQVAAEYLAYLMMLCMCFTVILGMLCGACAFLERDIPVMFFGKLFPVVCMMAAIQFVLYEIMTDRIAGLILQFLGAVGMAYLSGCFYPAAFFPEGLQRLGRVLPSGTALLYTDKCLLRQAAWMEMAILLLETVVFLRAAVRIRKYRIGRE